MRTFCLAAMLVFISSYSLAAPQVGDPAPDFKLQGSDGNSYTLEQFRDKKAVVIAFFPKAFTGG
jgi:thioredoxin-dependent peroxiredoxin